MELKPQESHENLRDHKIIHTDSVSQQEHCSFKDEGVPIIRLNIDCNGLHQPRNYYLPLVSGSSSVPQGKRESRKEMVFTSAVMIQVTFQSSFCYTISLKEQRCCQHRRCSKTKQSQKDIISRSWMCYSSQFFFCPMLMTVGLNILCE